jgi:DNA polymerase-3 subunit alpha
MESWFTKSKSCKLQVLRRAMGKKDMVEMIKQREKFLKGALENQIAEEIAMAIFDKIEKFASYGFNKSHAAAYGYLSYVTAFLKANYPGQWMAALMTCDRDDLTKIAKFIREGQSMGIPMLPPDVNEAGASFQATAQGIRFAMTGVKGVGTAAVEAIIAERTQKGPFKSFYEFFKRMDHKKIGKKNIENLVEAGCFDFTGWSRDALLVNIEPIYAVVSKNQKEKALGILSLFSTLGDQDEKRFNIPPKILQPLSYQEMLLREKNLLGFFLTGHPLNEYKSILQKLSYTSLEKVEEMSHETVFRSAFIIESIQARIAFNSQKKFAIVTVSDGIERQEIFIWTDLYEEKGHLLKENQLIYALLQVDKKDELRLSCRWLTDLTRVNEEVITACDKAYDKAKYQIERMAHMKQTNPKEQTKNSSKMNSQKEKAPSEIKPLSIILDADSTRLSHVLQLKQLFAEHRGTIPIQIQFHRANQPLAHLHIESKHGVLASQQLKEKLQQMKCVLSLQ